MAVNCEEAHAIHKGYAAHMHRGVLRVIPVQGCRCGAGALPPEAGCFSREAGTILRDCHPYMAASGTFSPPRVELLTRSTPL